MNAMICAPQPTAVEEGAKVLMGGGNAIDAAVTCAFVQSVVDPQMCGIGGYMLLNLYLAGTALLPAGQARPFPASAPVPGKVGELTRSLILDAPALAGSKVTPTMWEDLVIRPNPDGWGFFLKGKVNDVGYQAICTPGMVKGMALMLNRWGTISWEQAIAPAARIAEEGFQVSSHLATGWKTQAKYPEGSSLLDYLESNPEARRLYLKEDGAPYDAGEILRNPEHAATLRHLAASGAEDFYQGELARRMSHDLAIHGSFVTTEDFSEYEARDESPVEGAYRGYTIASSSPPHGGPTLLAILNILEGYDLTASGHNSPEYIWLVARAMKAAFADRNRQLGDPKFVAVPLDRMISKARAEGWRRRIDTGNRIEAPFTPDEPPDTTHVSVVDRDGNCVALTHSLGISSGVITPGLGFMYNNSMINFHPQAGNPNSLAPRKERTTGMTPTIVFNEEKPVMVLGAPGATRIITSIVQVLLNVIDFGMDISDAVLAPRFDCQGEVIQCQARIPEYVCAEVRKQHPIERLPQSHGGLGLVHAIAIDPETGKLSGGADTGSGGMALEID